MTILSTIYWAFGLEESFYAALIGAFDIPWRPRKSISRILENKVFINIFVYSLYTFETLDWPPSQEPIPSRIVEIDSLILKSEHQRFLAWRKLSPPLRIVPFFSSDDWVQIAHDASKVPIRCLHIFGPGSVDDNVESCCVRMAREAWMRLRCYPCSQRDCHLNLLQATIWMSIFESQIGYDLRPLDYYLRILCAIFHQRNLRWDLWRAIRTLPLSLACAT